MIKIEFSIIHILRQLVAPTLKMISIRKWILFFYNQKLILSLGISLFETVFLDLYLTQVLDWLVLIRWCLLIFLRIQIILAIFKAAIWILWIVDFRCYLWLMSSLKLVLVEWVSSLVFEYWSTLVFRFVSHSMILRRSFEITYWIF